MPERQDWIEGLTRQLYGLVCRRAADEELKVDPDEERLREEHAEDMAPYRASSSPTTTDSDPASHLEQCTPDKRTSAQLSGEVLEDLATVGADYMARGYITETSWGARMKSEFGEGIGEHLPGIRERAFAEFERVAQEVRSGTERKTAADAEVAQRQEDAS